MKKLSEQDMKILKVILATIESRIHSGSLQGGLTAEGVKYTVYYLLKYER